MEQQLIPSQTSSAERADPEVPGVETSCGPELPSPIAKEAMKDQLVAAGRRAMLHGIRLISQASSVLASMAVSSKTLNRLPPPPKASPSMCVQLRLLNGQVITQVMAADCGLQAVQEAVAQQTHIPPIRQSLVVVEERNRSPNLQTFSRYFARQMSHSRQDTRGFLLGWANFLMCPEVFARELSGRGLLGAILAALQLRMLELQREKSGQAILSVEPMGGQVLSMKADPEQPLLDVQLRIEQQTHIMVEQQSLLILERPVPGVGSHLLDQGLLMYMEAAKAAILSFSLAKSLWLQYNPWSRGMKLDVSMTDGRCMSLLVTEETTVADIRRMVGAAGPGQLEGASEPLSALSFLRATR